MVVKEGVVRKKVRFKSIEPGHFLNGSLSWTRYLEGLEESKTDRIVSFFESLEKGRSYSVLELAERDNVTLRTVRRRLQELSELGLLDKVKLDNGKPGRSFKYILR